MNPAFTVPRPGIHVIASFAVCVLAAVALALAPSSASADNCGTPPGGIKHVKTKHAGCTTAFEIARLSFLDLSCRDKGCTIEGFFCNSKHQHMKCVKGNRKITYDF